MYRKLSLLGLVGLLFMSGCTTTQTTVVDSSGKEVMVPNPPKPGSPNERAKAHTELGEAYLSQSNIRTALEEGNKAVSIDARYALGYNLLGKVYMVLQDFPKAKFHLDRAMKLDSDNTDINISYGWHVCQTEKTDPIGKSSAYFDKAANDRLYQFPERPYLMMAACTDRHRQYQKSIIYYQRVQSLMPSDVISRYGLANAYHQLGDDVGAQKLLYPLLQVEKPLPAVLTLGIQVEGALNRRQKQMEYLKKLRRLYGEGTEFQEILRSIR